MKRIKLKESDLKRIVKRVINEQPNPPGPNGYPGGTPCYACINNQVETMLFPQSCLGQPYPSCAPTCYGYNGQPGGLPGGSASYNYPSIWSEIPPTNCGNTTPDTPCYQCVNGVPTQVELIGPNSSWCQNVPNGPQCGTDCTQIPMNAAGQPGYFPLTNDPNMPCTGTCNKSCQQLVPNFKAMAQTKPCNWLNNRLNAFTQKLTTLTPGSCQHKRVECKQTIVQALIQQQGC